MNYLASSKKSWGLFKISQGYQFWIQTDERGYFTIKNIRANTYNLYAWVPGIIGDYKHDVDIVIQPGMLYISYFHRRHKLIF